jgi:hypothetical protein
MVRVVLAVCLCAACPSPLAPVAYAADAGQEGAKRPEEKGLTRAQYMSQVVEQLAFVSSILAGFAFSVIVQLVVSTQKGKAVAWALGTFMVSASSLLFSTCLCSILRFAFPLTEARGGDETLAKLTPSPCSSGVAQPLAPLADSTPRIRRTGQAGPAGPRNGVPAMLREQLASRACALCKP